VADREWVAVTVRTAVGPPSAAGPSAEDPRPADPTAEACEGGEGVISTAIAVLVMALLGAAMWVAFNGVFQTAESRIAESVENLGGR